MGDHRVRRDDRSQTGLRGSESEVGFFPVHEEAGVEPAELVPAFAGNEEQAARHDVHLADAVPLPAAERLRVEEPRALERGRQPEREAGEAPDRGSCPAGARVDGSVGIQRPSAVDAVFRVTLRERDEMLDGARMDNRVGVEQEQVLARSQCLAARLTPAPKPMFSSSASTRTSGNSVANHVHCPVVRRVVEDDQLERHVPGGLEQRGEAPACFVLALIRDDEDWRPRDSRRLGLAPPRRFSDPARAR